LEKSNRELTRRSSFEAACVIVRSVCGGGDVSRWFTSCMRGMRS
jgi:hypothetical protein